MVGWRGREGGLVGGWREDGEVRGEREGGWMDGWLVGMGLVN